MTTNEYVQFVLEVKKEPAPPQIEKMTAYEAAQLISGSLAYSLYETLCTTYQMSVVAVGTTCCSHYTSFRSEVTPN